MDFARNSPRASIADSRSDSFNRSMPFSYKASRSEAVATCELPAAAECAMFARPNERGNRTGEGGVCLRAKNGTRLGSNSGAGNWSVSGLALGIQRWSSFLAPGLGDFWDPGWQIIITGLFHTVVPQHFDHSPVASRHGAWWAIRWLEAYMNAQQHMAPVCGGHSRQHGVCSMAAAGCGTVAVMAHVRLRVLRGEGRRA